MKISVTCEKNIRLVLLVVLFVFGTGGITHARPVNERTQQVQDAIVAAVDGVSAAADVTDTHLAAITTLNLRAKGISALKTGDFEGLTGLTDLNLYGNELSSLPDGIFSGLTALTTLRLGGNTVDPMSITVSLEKVADGQFKAVVPIGAPFDIVFPISAMNGSIAGNATTVTIAKGNVESSALTITRTEGITDAVTVDIGTLPGLPDNHYGYTVSKSATEALEVIGVVVSDDTETETETETEIETPTNSAPVFSDGTMAVRAVAENTDAGVNIGSVVAATDTDSDDTLTYTLSGVAADSFDIDTTTGQLKTKAALDYETRRVYAVTINVSDGSLTDTITVLINIIDRADTALTSTSVPVSDRTAAVRDAIVAAVPNISDAGDVTDIHLAAITELNLRATGITTLEMGDFSGLTGLTNLNLYGNMLNRLPMGIFDGLTALTTLRLGGNVVAPMPLIVSLQQVDANQYQAIIPTGAPFDVVVPIDATTVTIPQGSMKSDTFTAIGIPEIGALPMLPANHFGYVLAKSAVCNRTSQVAEAIAAVVPGVTNCHNVSEIDLAGITELDLSNKSITSLKTGDFSGMLSLKMLDLSDNRLSFLSHNIFEGLLSLKTLNLSGNTVAPLPLTILLEKVGEDQFKAVLPTGAPFAIILPVLIKTGNVADGTITVTILQGSVESGLRTITRTSGTTAAVTVDIGTLPSLPAMHSGYALAKSDTLPLEILEDINVAPMFTDGSTTTREVAENTDAGVNIGSAVAATDANNDTLTYTLSGDDAGSFDIVSTSGQLQTKAVLDFETKTSYSVTITVSDGTLTDTIAVTIDITDILELPPKDESEPVTKTDTDESEPVTETNNAPVFTEGENATRSVAENTGSGVDIGSAVSATDDDNDTLTYSLGGTDATSFSIDSSSGQLRTSATLDYETEDSYSVTITVSDGNGGSATINVTLNITDVDKAPDNNAPVFTEGESAARSVAENTGSGVDIGSAVSATDADGDTLSYALSGTDASLFSIDSSSGQLQTSAALDYESEPSYSVIVTVSDGKGGSATINVTISVTNVNESPVFTDSTSTTRTIAENAPAGVNIGNAVAATDDDGDTLTYTLSGTDAALFDIESATGQLKTETSLDFETDSSYTVSVSVSDGEGGTTSITVTINVTDLDETPSNNPPVFTAGDDPITRAVAENMAAGTDVGDPVSATDADGNTLAYLLSGDDASAFSIDNDGQLKTSTPLNHEDTDTYSVTITVSDGGFTDTIIVNISVTDANDAPVFNKGLTTTLSIAENTAATNIGPAFTATDEDGDTLTYTLDENTDATLFRVDATGQLRTLATLDHETESSYSVTITVSDGNGGSDEIVVTINVTDVDENLEPVFTDGDRTTREIAENTGAGVNIGAPVAATDADEDNLEYTLGGTNAAAFDIGSTTGQLRTKAPLDFETKDEYSVTITVDDSNGGSDEIEVAITVTDVDENVAPVFTDGDDTTREVAENTGAGVNIGAPVAATDADEDTLEYTLGGTNADAFEIGSTTGQLRTKAPLDYETKDEYFVAITVDDDKGGSDEIEVAITITDVDENIVPVFTDGDDTTREVAENTGAGVNIGTSVAATDANNDTLTYTLGGDDAAAFDIGSTTGQLRTKAPLDYETKDEYSVTITVDDDNGGSDEIVVTINVTDVDENRAPVAINTIAAQTLTVGGASVSVDVSGNFSDPDNDELTFTVSSNNASVATVGISGTQVTITPVSEGTATITVTASDGTSAATQTISVTVNAALTEEDWMPDANLRAKVRAALGLQEGEALTQQAMTRLTRFDAYVSQIENLTGLEYATNLTSLNLNNNQISDISALENLTSLTTLWLFVNQISDISALENLTSLTTLRLSVNQISDISALENLTSLTTLWLSGNQVSDISALENLTSLTTLRLFVNQISDISALENLTSLTRLYLSNNQVSDISALENLTSLTWLDLRSNQISDISALENLTSLTTLRLSANQVSDISALENLTALTELHLSGNQISDYGPLRRLIAAIAEITEHPGLTLDITIPDTSSSNSTPVFTESGSTTRSIAENTDSGVNIGNPVAATDANNDNLTYSLGGTDASSFSIVSTTGQLQTSAALDFETDSSYTVTVSVSDGKGGTASITVTINVIDVDESYPLAGRTQEVQGAIVALVDGKDSAADVTVEDLASITFLNLSNKDIISLKIGDFDGLTALTTLYITGNALSSLPLGIFDNNTALTTLSLTGNALTSLPSGIFDNNTALTDISLSGNALSSLPSGIFDNNTALTDISLSGNALSSLPSGIFDNNTALTDISLSGNALSSLPSGIFDNNTALTALHMNNNALSSLPSGIFDNNTALTTLYIAGNVLSSLPSGIFDNNTALTTLSLTGNALSSLPSGIFDNNTTLTTLSLTRNALSSLPSGIFDNNTTLTALYLNVNVLSSLPSGIFDNNTTLTMLYLSFNDISDISELEELTSLTNLKLSGNQISDYGPLRRLIAAIAEITEHPGLTLDITIPDASSSNSTPVFTESGSTTRSIAENTDSGVNIGNPVAATDANNDNLTYSLGGTDASSFSIISTTGQLQTSAALDFETDPSYTVTVSVSDGKGGTASITVTITVLDVVENRAPRFSDGARTTRSVAENTDSGIDIGSAVTATDADNDTLTYSLSGDPDAASFSIVRTSGQLQTKDALDRETKPSYSVTVSVSDGNGGTDSITVTINVTNVNEAPEFSDGSSTTRSVNENAASGQNIGTAVAATDEDSDTLTYTLGGTNASSFSIVDTTGQLQTKSALDHETKDSYQVTITVSDGNGGSDSITVTIDVTDVDETTITLVSERTAEVRDAIIAAAGVNSAAELTAEHLTAITSLDLSSKSITSLKVGDFDGLTALTTLDLSDNNLSELPSGIFDKLTWLQFLDLDNNSFSTLPSGIFEKLASSIFVVEVSGNTVDPLPLTVSLSKVNEGQFKAVVPTGAPFDIVVPITVTNGSMSGATSVTISTGAVESPTHTATRTIGTTAAATVNIGTLPGIRSADTGYELVKPATGLPLTVITAVGGSPYSVSNTDPQVPQETALFPNYPNPSNPETWIPYQLSKPAKVTLTIYNMRGVVVRQLKLEQQQAGVYRSRSRAAYWDGRNEIGESVASDVYFYLFKAGEYTALRKMLIRK